MAIDPADRRWSGIVIAAALVVAGVQYAATAALPFFSETWSHLAVARSSGIADCFDPVREPLRPLQHLWFFAVDRGGMAPALARLPGFVAHAASCLLLYLLGRQLGARPVVAAAASLAFALAPNVTSLVWVAAVGWPWRVFAMLAGLVLLLDHARAPRAASGAGWLLAFLLALAANQGAVVLPAIGLLLVAGRRPADAAVLLRRWWFLVGAAIAVAYVLYVGLLRPAATHQVVGGGAMLTNVAKAALALLPADLRLPWLDALRGGGGARLAALAGLALLAAALVWWFWRSPPIVRALLAAILLELAPALLVTGFVPRYAYLAHALLALAIVRSLPPARHALWAAPAVLLLLGWVRDTAGDVADLRAAGRIVERVRLEAEALRARAGGATAWLIDAPQFLGREQDLPVFDWGLGAMLERAGIPGPWRIVVSQAKPWQRGVHRVTAAELGAVIGERAQPFVRFDASGRVIARR